MSFRRRHDRVRSWTAWLDRNREELLSRCSVPSEIALDERRWRLLMQEGSDESGWDCNMLSAAEANSLLALLIREYGEEALVSSGLRIALGHRRATREAN